MAIKNRTSSLWSAEEHAAIEPYIHTENTPQQITELAVKMNRSFESVRQYIARMRKQVEVADAKVVKQRADAQLQAIREAADNPPIDTNDKERIRQLEAEVARLREQKKWETHSDVPSSTGGLLTLRASDHHYCDENHLLSCANGLEEKVLVCIENYKPDRIQLVMGDDWIAGRGVFREQDLQSAVSDPEQQLMVGSIKFRRFAKRLRSVTDAPIVTQWLKGNHEMAPGKTNLGPSLFLRCRTLCEDVAGLAMTMHYDRAVLNLADQGAYNVLVYHGFGHSNSSPNSPKFVDSAKNDIIMSQRTMKPEDGIRRVLSGHTHWASLGLERIVDLPFDTTGGLQRNNRVQLGMNSRPIGWIVYVSPRGAVGEIQQPIMLQPDAETYQREMTDPHLGAANRKDCGECLREYDEFMSSRGLAVNVDPIGVTNGRW